MSKQTLNDLIELRNDLYALQEEDSFLSDTSIKRKAEIEALTTVIYLLKEILTGGK